MRSLQQLILLSEIYIFTCIFCRTPFTLRTCFLIILLGMGLAVLFMVVVGVTMGKDSSSESTSSPDQSMFSRAAVATDVGLCSDIGR